MLNTFIVTYSSNTQLGGHYWTNGRATGTVITHYKFLVMLLSKHLSYTNRGIATYLQGDINFRCNLTEDCSGDGSSCVTLITIDLDHHTLQRETTGKYLWLE